MSNALEVRTAKATVELRKNDAGGPMLAGYAIVYNSMSQNLGGFVERILPGAADQSLREQVRVLARYNHDDNMLLGTTSSGTLRLSSDDTGLRYEVDLPDTTYGRDLAVLAARGDVSKSSFAFRVNEDGEEWGVSDAGFPMRSVSGIQLVDVAPVNTPAYNDTTAGLRSLADRTGLAVDKISSTPIEEVRALITGGPLKRSANDPADCSMLTQAMAWFTAVDSIVDEAQEALAGYLEVPSPDPDDAGEPADMPMDAPMMMSAPRSLRLRLELAKHVL